MTHPHFYYVPCKFLRKAFLDKKKEYGRKNIQRPDKKICK